MSCRPLDGGIILRAFGPVKRRFESTGDAEDLSPGRRHIRRKQGKCRTDPPAWQEGIWTEEGNAPPACKGVPGIEWGWVRLRPVYRDCADLTAAADLVNWQSCAIVFLGRGARLSSFLGAGAQTHIVERLLAPESVMGPPVGAGGASESPR